MKVLVLGAGVAGVAAAYYLWRDGHEVVVADRQSAAARETSFGNAGGLCPSFAGPWAAPGMIGKVLKMSLQRNSAIRFAVARAAQAGLAGALDGAVQCRAISRQQAAHAAGGTTALPA